MLTIDPSKRVSAPGTAAPGLVCITGGGATSPDKPLNLFQRLEKGFAEKGWRLYRLQGETLYVTIPAWGMYRTLPSLQAAEELLKLIGGTP